MKTFGVNVADGTISLCRAKPENRGKGNCKHEEHVELFSEDSTPAAIRQRNEAILARLYNNSDNTTISKNEIQSPAGGKALTAQEFKEASSELANAFPQEDWEYINKFYKEFSERLEDGALQEKFDSSAENIHAYLTSDSETAEKIRDFLGKEVDLNEFSQILVREVKSMRRNAELINSPRRDSIARIVMTSLDNDMTKERYVASVLFFGGRCCYCNVVMSKQEGDHQASGEHITPISPESDENVIGGTRFGNMALACLTCNRERKNKDLDEWMSETKLVSEEQKEQSLKRIEQFRKFALYQEYSSAESNLIKAEIVRLRGVMAELPSKRKVYSKEDFAHIRREVHTSIYELREKLRH